MFIAHYPSSLYICAIGSTRAEAIAAAFENDYDTEHEPLLTTQCTAALYEQVQTQGGDIAWGEYYPDGVREIPDNLIACTIEEEQNEPS